VIKRIPRDKKSYEGLQKGWWQKLAQFKTQKKRETIKKGGATSRPAIGLSKAVFKAKLDETGVRCKR